MPRCVTGKDNNQSTATHHRKEGLPKVGAKQPLATQLAPGVKQYLLQEDCKVDGNSMELPNYVSLKH